MAEGEAPAPAALIEPDERSTVSLWSSTMRQANKVDEIAMLAITEADRCNEPNAFVDIHQSELYRIGLLRRCGCERLDGVRTQQWIG